MAWHGNRYGERENTLDAPEVWNLSIGRDLQILQQQIGIVDQSTVNLLIVIDGIIKKDPSADPLKDLFPLTWWAWIQKLKALREKLAEYKKSNGEVEHLKSTINNLDEFIKSIENVLVSKFQLQDGSAISVANSLCENMSEKIPAFLVGLYQKETLSAEHFIFSTYIAVASLEREIKTDVHLLFPDECALYRAFYEMDACQNIGELKETAFKLLKEKKISESTFIGTVECLKIESLVPQISTLYQTLQKFDATVQNADFSETDQKKVYSEVDALINEALQPAEAKNVEDVEEIQTPVLDDLSSKVKAVAKTFGFIGHKLGIASMLIGAGLVVVGVLGVLASATSVLSTWGLSAPLALLGVWGSIGLISAGAALITAGDIGKNVAKKQHDRACDAQRKFGEVCGKLKEDVAKVRSANVRALSESSRGGPSSSSSRTPPMPKFTSLSTSTPIPTPTPSPSPSLSPTSSPTLSATPKFTSVLTPTSILPATPTSTPVPTLSPILKNTGNLNSLSMQLSPVYTPNRTQPQNSASPSSQAMTPVYTPNRTRTQNSASPSIQSDTPVSTPLGTQTPILSSLLTRTNSPVYTPPGHIVEIKTPPTTPMNAKNSGNPYSLGHS